MDVFVLRQGSDVQAVYTSIEAAKESIPGIVWIPSFGEAPFSSFSAHGPLTDADFSRWTGSVRGPTFSLSLDLRITRHELKGA